MNRLVVWALVAGLSVVVPSVGGSQDGLRLTGSGATFPFPLYSTWFKAFSAKQKGVSVDYQGKGSGAGIQDLLNQGLVPRSRLRRRPGEVFVLRQ